MSLNLPVFIQKTWRTIQVETSDEFRRKIKVSDEEIGELQEIPIEESSIIVPPQEENVRNRNIDTVSQSISQQACLPDVNEAGQVVWNK